VTGWRGLPTELIGPRNSRRQPTSANLRMAAARPEGPARGPNRRSLELVAAGLKFLPERLESSAAGRIHMAGPAGKLGLLRIRG
jgi:hypothetical protein